MEEDGGKLGWKESMVKKDSVPEDTTGATVSYPNDRDLPNRVPWIITIWRTARSTGGCENSMTNPAMSHQLVLGHRSESISRISPENDKGPTVAIPDKRLLG